MKEYYERENCYRANLYRVNYSITFAMQDIFFVDYVLNVSIWWTNIKFNPVGVYFYPRNGTEILKCSGPNKPKTKWEDTRKNFPILPTSKPTRQMHTAIVRQMEVGSK